MIIGAWGMWRKRGWKNPYITDGLVAMWDCEWNAGGGVHDDTATTWVDLTGNGLDATIVDGVFSDRGFSTTRNPNKEVIGATIPSIVNSAWFTQDGPFVAELAVDVSSFSSASGWSNNFLYEDSRLVIGRRHAQNWDLSTKCYIGSSNQPSIRVGTGVSGFPNPLTVTIPFCAANTWETRYDFRSHIRFDNATPSSFSNPSPIAGTNANICRLASASALTVYIKRIAIYKGIDDDRSAANYAVDKGRFGLP